MKKKLLFSSLVFSLFASLTISKDTISVKAKDSSNGYHVEEVVRDKFNKETVDATWKLNGASQKHYYNALHCLSPVTYGSGPYISGAKLSTEIGTKTTYEFTIYPQSVLSGANISFNIGMASIANTQSEPNVDCKIQLWDTSATFVDYQHQLALEQPTSLKNQVFSSVNLYDATTTVTINIERKAERRTELYVEYIRDGKVVSSSKQNPFTLTDPRYPDGYCGFFWDCLEMDMTDFKVSHGDEVVLQDSFETNTISFTTAKDAGTNFNVFGLNETNCYYANINSIEMDSGNDSIINSYQLVEQENVSTPYEMTYNIKLNELNNNSFVGFGLGLKDGDARIDATNAIGLIKSEGSDVEVVSIKNGVIDRSNNYSINAAKLAIGRSQNYKLTLDSAHRAYLNVNGSTFKFENVDYSGRVGLGLIDLGSTSASKIELNEFRLMANTYKKYASSDYSNNFNGVKESPDGFSFDPYINTQKYYIGQNVELENDWTTGINDISFSSSTPYSGFGVREKYSEFICEYDFEVSSRKNFQYIGLAFGRESVVDMLTPSSNTNKAFLFRCDNDGASTAIVSWGADCKFDNGSDTLNSELNIFDVEHNKYHIMFVGKNRTLYVYYKEVGAPDSEMGILRACIPNVNIDGYVSIVGNSGATFQVTNYKMINLSDECKEESALTLRESFEYKNNVSEKLALDGVSTVKNGKLEMNYSNVSTVNPYLYEIIRFTTYDLDDSLQIFFSKGKKLIIDAKNNKIVVNENDVKTSYDCGAANLKNIKGKRFEITIIGNQVKVGYKGYYDPADKLSAELVSHTFATPLLKDNISLGANGKVVLDDLYIFDLGNVLRCESFDYEEDPDNASIWIPKKDYDASKVYNPEKKENENKGCKGSAGGMLLVLALALPLVLRKKEEK